VILLALSGTLNLLLDYTRGSWIHKNIKCLRVPGTHDEWFLTQVWRGNVDVKPFLYQSDPSNPDPEGIITCSDYLVGYQMKGSQTIAIERKNMKDLVMRLEDKDGEITGFFYAARN
jgi:hypothetical protein